jgi:hypothetical protein
LLQAGDAGLWCVANPPVLVAGLTAGNRPGSSAGGPCSSAVVESFKHKKIALCALQHKKILCFQKVTKVHKNESPARADPDR